MRRYLALMVVLAACGNGDEPEPTAPVGAWRQTGETVNGWLEVTANEYALGLAAPTASGVISPYTLSGGALQLGSGGSVPFTLEDSGTTLTLEPQPGRTLTFEKSTPEPVETLAVTGTITYATGAIEMTAPRAALIFLGRDGSEVGFVNDPRDDRALTFAGGAAAIDFSRDRGALGTERIVFGDRAAVAIGLVVVYDDRDASGSLADLFAVCTPTSTDCIRGIAPVYLGSRDGTSAELSASPYGFLRTGWSHAVLATDARSSGRVGLLSTDPTKTLRYDVTIPADAATVTVPDFRL